MIIAFDTYYYEGYSYTVGGVFESWTDSDVCYYVTSKRDCIDSEYKSGELYKRELPCIMQCLSMVNIENIDTIVIDGFVWLSNDGNELIKGLGARLNDAIKMRYGVEKNIVGVAKNPYHVKIPNCIEIKHGLESEKPLFVTCNDEEYVEYYAVLVSRMHGDYRIPTILKLVDSKSRELKDGNEEELQNSIEESKPIEIDFGSFEEWLAETEKNGFKYK
jgi:deoxyinosine 3'endonuclease (endonuclease V)